MLPYIIFILITVIAGVLTAESLFVNHKYRRNPERLEQLCRTENDFLNGLEKCSAGDLRDTVIVIGGFSDALRGYTYSVIREFSAKTMAEYDVFYRQHSECVEIDRLIAAYAARNKKIIVIGHSWGADRAANTVLGPGSVFLGLAPETVIETLITLDPVSRKGPPQADLRRVKRWINVYMDYTNASWFEQSNDIARIGGPWGAVSGAENIPCDPDLNHKDARRMFTQHIKPLLHL